MPTKGAQYRTMNEAVGLAPEKSEASRGGIHRFHNKERGRGLMPSAKQHKFILAI